jgi:hypothetical protein
MVPGRALSWRVAASEFLVKHPDLVGIKVKGIIFLASYPARDIS